MIVQNSKGIIEGGGEVRVSKGASGGKSRGIRSPEKRR